MLKQFQGNIVLYTHTLEYEKKQMNFHVFERMRKWKYDVIEARGMNDVEKFVVKDFCKQRIPLNIYQNIVI